jgi:hypothetical protein
MRTIQHPYSHSYSKEAGSITAWKRFINWCSEQEENRFMWLAIAIVGHGCFLTIITIGSILLSGNSFILWPIAIGAMSMTLVTNLAALPTKITVPVFFLSVLIDLVIIGVCIAHGFDISSTYI